MSFSPPVVGCLLKKAYKRRGHGHSRAPLAQVVYVAAVKTREGWESLSTGVKGGEGVGGGRWKGLFNVCCFTDLCEYAHDIDTLTNYSRAKHTLSAEMIHQVLRRFRPVSSLFSPILVLLHLLPICFSLNLCRSQM